MATKTHLLLIDPQNDFMDLPGSTLPVTGAVKDMKRVAAFIDRRGQRLYDIHVTLDSHHACDIAHKALWRNKNGDYPAPFTIIGEKEIKNKTWYARMPQMQQILSSVRAVDTVARYGGDEFVAVLGDLSLSMEDAHLLAAGIAEKIRAALDADYTLNCDLSDQGSVQHHCTSSIGVSIFSGSTYCKEELIQQADRAMYRAKAAGRNLICFHNN